MTKQEFIKKREAIKAEMVNLEGAEYDKKMRELRQLTDDFNAETAAMSREEKREAKPKSQFVRELLADARKKNSGMEREIIVGTTSNPGAGLNSGAIELNIHDLIPNLEEGTGLPSGCTITTGVTGDDVYPTDASDMEIEEVGEVATLNDQTIDFDKVKVTPSRVSLSCDISNKLIDNLAFDIMSHISKKISKAWRKYLARKIYSQANFSGVKGGFANLTPAGTITLGNGTAAKSILTAVADFVNKGFDVDSLCITIDAVTEAKLKLEPLAAGEGQGFVIQNGKLLGYEYTVSHYINTVLGGDSKTGVGNTTATQLYKTTASYLGIGFYEYLKPQQHGEWRLTTDGTSKAMAKKNCVNVTLNTEVSVTNLSNHIYDEDGNAVSAFAVYTLADGEAAPKQVVIKNTTTDPVNTKEVSAQ